MSVRVYLNEGNSLILIEAIGPIVRREAGWAAERVCELVRAHEVSGILIDAFQAEEQSSPSLSGEMIAGFLLAMETTTPIAYVRPSRWDEAYYGRVRSSIRDLLPPHVALFDEIEAANDWLRTAAAGSTITA